LPAGKAFPQKGLPERSQIPTALSRKCFRERGAGVHGLFNFRGGEMITDTDGDRVDALHGEECLPNIFGHHVDKVDRTPTGGHVDSYRRMPLLDVEGLDKAQVEHRLIQFGVEDVMQPFQNDRAVRDIRWQQGLRLFGHEDHLP
jgi:hypothetical protein